GTAAMNRHGRCSNLRIQIFAFFAILSLLSSDLLGQGRESETLTSVSRLREQRFVLEVSVPRTIFDDADASAYLVHVAIGDRRLLPSVVTNKSWKADSGIVLTFASEAFESAQADDPVRITLVRCLDCGHQTTPDQQYFLDLLRTSIQRAVAVLKMP